MLVMMEPAWDYPQDLLSKRIAFHITFREHPSGLVSLCLKLIQAAEGGFN